MVNCWCQSHNHQTGAFDGPVENNDPDDQIIEATYLDSIPPGGSTNWSDSIYPGTDVDMFMVFALAEQTFGFDIDSNAGDDLDSYIRLFNNSGTQLAWNDDALGASPETNSQDSYLEHTFAANNIYYLGISHASNTSYNPLTGDGDENVGNYTGNYELIVSDLSMAGVDTDDQISEANDLGSIPIGSNANWLDNINPATDVDMFSFNVSAGQTFGFDIDTIETTSRRLDSGIRLFDSSGTQLAWNNDALGPDPEIYALDSYLEHTFASDGTYYLGISHAFNSGYNPLTGNGDRDVGGPSFTGDYELIVTNIDPSTPDDAYEENDDLQSATDPLGNVGNWQQTYLSSIDGPAIQADYDWYKININPGYEHLVVDLQFTHAEGNINIAVADADGSGVTFAASASDNESIDILLPGPGTYYLVMFNGDAGNLYDLWWDGLYLLPGDASLDGQVSLLDLDILGRNWGQAGDWTEGDFNRDGQITLADLDILGQYFGQSSLTNKSNQNAQPNMLELDSMKNSSLTTTFHSITKLINDDDEPITLF